MEGACKQALILAAGIPCMNIWYKWPMDSKPKCLAHVNGQIILERNVKIFRKYGIEDIIVVVNYRKDDIIKFSKDNNLNLIFVESPSCIAHDGAFESFRVGLEKMKNESFIFFEGDVTCSEEFFANLICHKKEFLLAGYNSTIKKNEVEMRIAKINKSYLPSDFNELKKEIMKFKTTHHPFEIGFFYYLQIIQHAVILPYVNGHVIEIDFYEHCDEGSRKKLIREYIKEIL